MSCDAQVPAVAPDANKYSRGKLVVVAGSNRYPGAAVLAARAGQRMGVGYTEVFCARGAVDVVRLSSPSLVVRPFDEFDARSLPASLENRPLAVCIGPGFVPEDPETDDLAMHTIEHAPCPVLVDGGALACLASNAARERLERRASNGYAVVVTPHGGEATRLADAIGVPVDAPDLARALHALVVLKGPDTYISDGDFTEAMLEGTPALAKAGTGDVLAGMIASLLAQGVEPFEAAMSAATFHARAGAAAASALTETSVCAEDLIDYIPAIL